VIQGVRSVLYGLTATFVFASVLPTRNFLGEDATRRIYSTT